MEGTRKGSGTDHCRAAQTDMLTGTALSGTKVYRAENFNWGGGGVNIFLPLTYS